MQNAYNPLVVGLQRQHYTQRMQNVRTTSLVNLAGMSLDGNCYGSFKGAHVTSLCIASTDIMKA